MGQQISNAGDENVDVVGERGARVDLAEVYYGYVSSRVEKLIRLAQSSLVTQVHDRSQSQQSSDIRQQLLQDGTSMISSPLVPVQNTLPSHFTDIPTVDLSCDADDYNVGVAVSEPAELHCHVPVRKTHNVDTGCQTVDESHHFSTRAKGTFECLLAETSDAESEAFSSMNDGVIANEIHVAKSERFGEIFLSRNGLEVDSKSGVCDAEPHCVSRPPQRTRSIATPETVLQSAYESRPPEIGSYLAVAPVVSSSDLGLSPIDETAEVLLTNTFANTVAPCATFDAFPSHYDHTRLQSSMDIVHNSKMSDPQTSVVYSFKNNPLVAESTLSQSDAGFLQAEGRISAEVLGTVEAETARDGTFSEGACHRPVNTCFSALESGNDETDRCAGTCNKSTVQVDNYCTWALQDKDVVFSGKTVTERAKSDIIASNSIPFNYQHQQSESRSTFLSEDGSCYSPQTSTTHFDVADRLNVSNDKGVDVKESEHCDLCSVRHSSELDVHGRSNADTSAYGSVWREWETALSRDFSTNNNESGNPKIAVMNMSPDTGPLIARRQVRHCSDSSAPLSSSLLSTAGCHLQAVPARSTSQLSLDDIILSPRAVPERLNFQQLEKFEGRYFAVC